MISEDIKDCGEYTKGFCDGCDTMKKHFDKLCDTLRTTKRALWLARALTAVHVFNNKESYNDYCNIQCERHKTSNFVPTVSESEWYERWEWVERKCRDKAEEYK